MSKVLDNGTLSLNENESVTPVARRAILDIALLKEKLSKAALVDSANLEVESKKGDVSARFSAVVRK